MDERSVRTERIIAGARLVLAIAAIGLVLLYPNAPDSAAYSVVVLYFLYALAIVWIVDRSLMRVDRLGFYSQLVDTLWFPIILVNTQGENSPFFLYYVFSLITASFRWGFRETLLFNTANVGMYVIVHFATIRSDFRFYQFWVRPTYLYVLACLIGYLGEHQKRVKRQLLSLAELSSSIPIKARFPRMLEEAMNRARTLFKVEQCILVLQDKETHQLYVRRVGEGIKKSSYQLANLPAKEMEFLLAPSQNWGYLVNPHRIVARVFGLKDVLAYDFDNQKPLSQSFKPNHRLTSLFEIKSMLSVPIFIGAEFRGRLYLVNRNHETFSYDDLQYLKLVVSQMAPLLENFRLLHRMQKVSLLEEKNRIARDLHDGLAQSLSSLDLRLEVCRKLSKEISPVIQDELQELQKIVRDEGEELRSYMKRLKTPAFGGNELEKAIRGYVRAYEKENGIRVKLSITSQGLDLPRKVSREVYQIIHEALTNVRKHADASHVTIDLEQQTDAAHLVISDDGRGFPLELHLEQESNSQKPWSIFERTKTLNGTLSVQSIAGKGSTLFVTIPIHAETQREQ